MLTKIRCIPVGLVSLSTIGSRGSRWNDLSLLCSSLHLYSLLDDDTKAIFTSAGQAGKAIKIVIAGDDAFPLLLPIGSHVTVQQPVYSGRHVQAPTIAQNSLASCSQGVSRQWT